MTDLASQPRRWASDVGDGRDVGAPRARSGGSRARDEGRTRAAWISHRRYARGRGTRRGTQGRDEGGRQSGTRGGTARDEGRTTAREEGRKDAGAGRGRTRARYEGWTPGSWSLVADSRTRGGTRIVERGEPGRGEERGAWVELEPAPIGTLMRVGTLMQCGMGN